ncbi:hypothetical protein EDF57_103560 [Novosphingobium sp. PhB55]|uniref:hypothetical protein n=1 Tax=Novosphingobium sp. PhB55 TaxID=2485106 RepID=UPI001065484D|nr:hypothetical protein [Novosphingobium sp. PhB55]TDW65376.1 hypothetical protein EDF57_103560 [Novosphingobium sp. PhB55]
MHRASYLGNSQPSAPQSASLISFVDRDAAADVICKFLDAIDAEGGPKTAFMQYAQANAARSLRLWGVAREPAA